MSIGWQKNMVSRSIILGALFFLGSCGREDSLARFEQFVAETPELTLISVGPDPDREGFQFAVLSITQPVDWTRPEGATFEQELYFSFDQLDAPSLLFSSGYDLDRTVRTHEIATLLNGPQLSAEHRFFDSSRPSSPDWDLLTVENSAADSHNIVRLFSELLSGPWISTGGSKGGMTALFHRAYYPADVDGTVAYVAPLSLSPEDPRYANFFEERADNPCRDQIRGLQSAFTSWRLELLSTLPAEIYTRLGPERALDGAIVELEWDFWQYQSLYPIAEDCSDIPQGFETAEEASEAADRWLPLVNFSDPSLNRYEPYFWQASYEIGYPLVPYDHLEDALGPGLGGIDQGYLPAPAPTFEPEAVGFVQDWLGTADSTLMFVYGSDDPWTEGAVPVSSSAQFTTYFVPGGDHLVTLSDLSDQERSEALERLSDWTQTSLAPPEPVDTKALRTAPFRSWDAVQAAYRERSGLR